MNGIHHLDHAVHHIGVSQVDNEMVFIGVFLVYGTVAHGHDTGAAFGKLRGEGSGRTAKRLLSAVSVGEIKLFSETPFAFADEVYVLEDSIGAAADYVLKSIAFGAKMKGENLIYCPCSVMPKKCDHIIFPDSRIAVVTQNKFMKFRNGEPVSMDSFYKPLSLQEDTDRRREDASHLLLEAARLIKKAKDIHDDLEAFYINAMDFSKSDTILEGIISRFYA